MYPPVRQLDTIRREARETQPLVTAVRFPSRRFALLRPKAQPQPCGS